MKPQDQTGNTKSVREPADRKRKRRPDSQFKQNRSTRASSVDNRTAASSKNEARRSDPRKKEKRMPDKRLYAPVNGEIIPLSSVADPVFAQKMMGDGIAFLPEGDLVVSPCSGTVVMIACAKNAVGLENDYGDQILVHIGLDTIDYKGKGIELLCQEGQKVRPGAPLVKLDRRFFDSVNADLTIPMTITNQDFGVYQILEGDKAQAGKTPVLERH